jgi:hypothetical protein
MALKRVALVAILAGAALVPVTAASAAHRPARIQLARVPLQKAQLGPAGASFALNYGSGSISDIGVVVFTSSGSARSSGASRDPLGGYVLDYGDPYTGGAGVTEIRSSVEAFRTRADARLELSVAPILDLFAGSLLGSPFTHVSAKKVKPPPVGQRQFGSLVVRAAPNLNPIVRLDEQVAAGRFVLDLTVTAGSVSAAKRVAPHLLRVLHRRLQLMLGGHALAKAPPEPREPVAGQAPGGPDLSTLILQPTDVGQPHAVNRIQLYATGPPALSDYLMLLAPAGTYTAVEQQIAWWPTATEATYGEMYGGGSPLGLLLAGGFSGTATPVDLSAVGDSAVGYLGTDNGKSTAYVVLTNGQAGESIVATGKGTLQASDVQSLAQAAAARLDAGLGP